MNWIPYPRPGTSVLTGRWLCTVDCGNRLEVMPLNLGNDGEWSRDDTAAPLHHKERVTAIAFMPEPYHE